MGIRPRKSERNRNLEMLVFEEGKKPEYPEKTYLRREEEPTIDSGFWMISNSIWTEWSTIQGVIGRVISNRPSAKREADLKLRARLLPELYDTKSNY